MKRPLIYLVGIVVVGLVLFLGLTSPGAWRTFHPKRDQASSGTPNLANGKTMFAAGDCATCHRSPGKNDDTLLGGGRSLDTAFGLFHIPNISPHEQDGIGGWSVEQFITVMREGVTGHGENAYPAFPYTSYQRMTADDLRDLFAYMKTLPPVAGKAPPHDLKFPYSIRRGVGLWRQLYLDGKPLPEVTDKSPEWLRGRYLVEGPGHCVECHSPRNLIGVIPGDQRFAGGPNAEGTGHVPNITPDETGISYWSVADIASYLKDGVSPIGIKAGGDMKEVVANTAQLSDADRLAMATYLKAVQSVEAPNAGVPKPNRTTEVVMIAPSGAQKQSRLDTLAATGEQLAKGDAFYAVATKPFWLAKPADGKAQEDGKVLPSTRLSVVAREGDLMQVRIDGWRQEGADSAIYALQGQRILQAALSPEAVAQVKGGKSVRDEATGQNWQEASLTAWVRQDSLNADLKLLWGHGQEMFNSSCATCHALPHSQDFLANQWIGTLNAMKRFTSLDDSQYRLLLAWLQNHSKDVGAASGEEGH